MPLRPMQHAMCFLKEQCATLEYLKDLLQIIHQILIIYSVIPIILTECA